MNPYVEMMQKLRESGANITRTEMQIVMRRVKL